MKHILKRMRERLTHLFFPEDIRQKLAQLVEINAHEYVARTLSTDPKYADSRHLLRYQSRSYSQHEEDGIIAEIFKRIGTTNKICVEFGSGNGLENNSTLLLVQQWKAHWIEAVERLAQEAGTKFKTQIERGQLSIHHALLSRENISRCFRTFRIPKEFDMLSIDVDGNDYWLWEALEEYRPRVVVIEYNALFPSSTTYISAYTNKEWNGTSYFGASLASLCALARRKKYTLVACDFSGVNAFFVREDEVQDKFIHAGNEALLYEPARYFLTYPSGHPRDFGDFQVESTDDH